MINVKALSFTLNANQEVLIGPVDNSQQADANAIVTIESSIPAGTSLGGKILLNLIRETPLGWSADSTTFGVITAEATGDFRISFNTLLPRSKFHVLITNNLSQPITADVVIETVSQEIIE